MTMIMVMMMMMMMMIIIIIIITLGKHIPEGFTKFKTDYTKIGYDRSSVQSSRKLSRRRIALIISLIMLLSLWSSSSW